MTAPTIRPASVANAKPLVGLYAESGGGKTHGALMIAKGFTGDMKRVCMIETEAGRGEAWADDPELGGYSVIPIAENFAPGVYYEAILAAQNAGIEALIIDSASHEWEGPGGILEMADENERGGKKGQQVWTRPKMLHKRKFIIPITQTPIALVIVCMRAKFPLIEIVGDNGKKDMKRAAVPSPTQSDDILSEMFVHGWLDKEAHHFHGTKYTRDSMREVFVDGQPLSIDTGRRLAAWAAKQGAAALFITPDQVIELEELCKKNSIPVDTLTKAAKVGDLKRILASDLALAKAWIEKRAARAGATSGQQGDRAAGEG